MPDDLQFDRAEYATPSATNCEFCNKPLVAEYYSVNGKLMCEACSASLRAQIAGLGSPATRLLTALGLGLGAALIGGGIYGAVMAYARSEWAPISIGVGYLVGKGVRFGSGGRGGWRYQLLAAALTYAAICGAYAFAVYHDLDYGPEIIPHLLFSAYRLPFMNPAENFLGIIIIGIGVFQAWQMNRGVNLQITGPHPLSASHSPTPPTAGA